ncbi:AI-2E family transporter [Candidatus Tisiphia endosymbiont of Nemotelus uliginosus]|uniref:AI-2E family transporter n=1 Tax=Candidatus Tisiphia endosymbiont of Nemotelus uliginosus TaxID=3077926 RepID=UPI0035C93084
MIGLDKAIFWVIVIGIMVISLTLISNILTPFVIAAIISYLLQPVIYHLSIRYKYHRNVIVAIIFVLFFSIFIVVVAVILPIIYQQITLLISKIPTYKDYLQTQFIPLITAQIQAVEPTIANKIKDLINNFANGLFSLMTSLANNIWHYTMVTINVFLVVVLIPIILFYLLRDWTKIITTIDNLLPLKNKQKIKQILRAINNTLAAYIRGQLNVCLILSTYYSIALWMVGVDLSVLLGVLSGFSIIIPFIGVLITFVLTMIVSYFAVGLGNKLLYIAIIYLIGIFVESYILTPKMIGDKIGLHPLWIIFAVLALGNLFGFIGIFFAVPIAGIIKVLFLSSIELYKSSKFYKS